MSTRRGIGVLRPGAGFAAAAAIWLFVAVPGTGGTTVAPAERDTIPPGAITDLRLPSLDAPDLAFDDSTGTLGGVPIVLTWTAPGDDGAQGTVWRYEVRFTVGEMTEARWPMAQPMADPLDLPLPSPAGQMEVVAFLSVGGLVPGAHYEIAVRARDEAGNLSPLSHPAGFTTPGESPTFGETIPIGDLELWAWGHRIPGPEVTCRYESSTLFVGGVSRPYLAPPERPPRIPPPDYRKVPFVRDLVARGVAFDEAVHRYRRERRDLLVKASRIAREGDLEAATRFLLASALVDTAYQANRNGGFVRFRGQTTHVTVEWWKEEPQMPSFTYHGMYTSPEQARVVLDWLRDQAETPRDEPAIALLARSGMMLLQTPRDIREFRSQVEHLQAGTRLDHLPPGPLSEGPAREFRLAMGGRK